MQKGKNMSKKNLNEWKFNGKWKNMSKNIQICENVNAQEK